VKATRYRLTHAA